MGFLSLVALLLPPIAATYVGTEMAKREIRWWICWPVGVAILALGWAMLLPASDVLQSARCHQTSDYRGCMEAADDPSE